MHVRIPAAIQLYYLLTLKIDSICRAPFIHEFMFYAAIVQILPIST